MREPLFSDQGSQNSIETDSSSFLNTSFWWLYLFVVPGDLILILILSIIAVIALSQGGVIVFIVDILVIYLFIQVIKGDTKALLLNTFVNLLILIFLHNISVQLVH